MNRITFCRTTIKRFEGELQKAYQQGGKRLVRRIRVLVATNRQKDITPITTQLLTFGKK